MEKEENGMSLFRKISKTVSKGMSTATEKAQQTVEISRLHSQINGKRKEIEKRYGDIGEAVFDAYLAKDLSLAESSVIPACEEIAAIRYEIDELDQRIMMLRNEKECICGKKVAFDTRFCPSCGHPFPEPPTAPEPKAEEIAVQPEEPEEPDAPAAADWADVGRTLPVYRMEQEMEPEETAEQAAIVCPSCRTTVDTGSKYCPSCGNPLS
jgi:RNA polymerase subunit RPABC4/transcription elongation factor Spt4